MGKVLSAQGSGYFPFCLTKGIPPLTGKGSDYPISLPLAKYMSWWWKVKTWKLTGSSACIETADGGVVNNWSTTSLVQDDTYTSSITSEENLVCGGIRQIKNNTAGGIGFIATSIQLGTLTDLWSIIFEEYAYIDGATIYPRMRSDGWYDTLIPGDPKVQAQLDPLSTFRIDGVTIPAYIRWFPSDTGFDDWSITGSQSFDLDPETYWSYGGTYDTTTGLPL